MAHLVPNLPNISKTIYGEASNIDLAMSRVVLYSVRGNISKHHLTASFVGMLNDDHTRSRTQNLKITRSVYRETCSSPLTSRVEEASLVSNGEVEVIENGWRVRKLVAKDGEMRKVAQVQAEAFHEPALIFDDFFFQFFQAEVLAGLLYRLRNSPPDRYACLVAAPSSDDSESPNEIVGVVDITVQRDEKVVQHLEGDKEYLYISGIAVLNNFRRQKVATALLKGCDMISTMWGFEYLALRAYEDDLGARKLYTNAGYNVVSGDPPWKSTWIGKKRRLLLIKRTNLGTCQS